MPDLFEKFSNNLESPAKFAVAVTPDDAANLEYSSRSVYIGGTGDLSVEMVGDQANVVFTNVQAGTVLPIRVNKVHSTGTTANSIVSMY
jgi:hypothetical protein